MPGLTPIDEPLQSRALLASRERAATRLTRGVTAMYAGGASLFGAILAEVFGLSGVGIQAVTFGSALLIWLSCVVMISGVPHLARFGTRRSVLALSSFAAAGLGGLVAVAEMFESFFLDSTVLQGLDQWALVVAIMLFMVGGILLKLAPVHDNSSGTE